MGVFGKHQGVCFGWNLKGAGAGAGGVGGESEGI